MPKKIIVLSILLALLALSACVTPTATPAPTVTPSPVGPVTVTILHTNDMHGYLEGEKLTGGDGTTFEFGGIVNALGTIVRIKQETGERTLIFDAGDLWQGTFASNRDEGKVIIAAMNVVGYDALTLGNHDFDHGWEVVKTRAAEAKFPFLAANLFEEATNQPPAWVKPYIVKEIAGVRFGIIGVTYSGTPFISKASNWKGLRFTREADAVKRILPEVQRQANVVIVVAHQGWDRDISMAEEVPGIDVLISGHTHVEQNIPKVVGNTVVVHAGYKARFVGRLDLQIDRTTKKIADFTRKNEVIPAVSTKATPPKEVVEPVRKLLADAAQAINRPIGETLIDLKRQFTADGRTTGEYPLGNLVVDAMLEANQAGTRPADIALHNNAGIRADLPKGPLTYGKLYEVLPFDNALTAMDLTGEQIKAILEHATSCPRVNILVAGMSFVYNCSKPQGERVSKVLIQGQPLDLKKVYRVQTIDYLAGGGDGQATFTQGTNLIYGDLTIDVAVEYVRKHSPLNPQVEGRIVEDTSR